MLPSPAYREMFVPENADEGSRVFVPLPCEDEPYVDALDHAVRIEDVISAWRCDGCGQKWGGEDVNCGYCGLGRDDT